MYIKKESDGTYKSFNFVPPSGASDDKNEVLFPFHDLQEPDYAATLAIEVKQQETIVKPAQLTGALTINLTINSQLTTGAKLYLKLEADATNRVVTLGTGFDADASDITVTASTVFCRTFVYDGTVFLPMYQ